MSKLFLVPTPIGNLEDITLRAVRVLKDEVALIVAEDTRKTGVLLKHYGISKPMAPFHQHNEHRMVEQLVSRLRAGETMALVTDAGTPAISDPGFLLVRAAIAASVEVECLPGATAFVPALVNSGLAADRFVFEGFLPHKKGRMKRILSIAEQPYTTVLYESPHRLIKTLEQLAGALGGDRRASVARELTKMFEENKRGSLDELIDYYSHKEIKGEIVLVIEGKSSDRKEKDDDIEDEKNDKG
jgi:16S rRNA (cytidine1402-2'-O)-methyltransferase